MSREKKINLLCKSIVIVLYINIIVICIIPTIKDLIWGDVYFEAIIPPLGEAFAVCLGAMWLAYNLDDYKIISGLLLAVAYTPVSGYMTFLSLGPEAITIQSFMSSIVGSLVITSIFGFVGALFGWMASYPRRPNPLNLSS